MLEPGERLGLALKQPDPQLVNELPTGDDLERHRSLRILLFGLVDDPHATGADLPDTSEVADLPGWDSGLRVGDHARGCPIVDAAGRIFARSTGVPPVARLVVIRSVIRHAATLSSGYRFKSPCRSQRGDPTAQLVQSASVICGPAVGAVASSTPSFSRL